MIEERPLFVKTSTKPDGEYVTFAMHVRMKSRWVSHFLAMLKKMQQYGDLGATRYVGIYSDGDGDFRPKFVWDENLPCDAAPAKDEGGNVTYDAG